MNVPFIQSKRAAIFITSHLAVLSYENVLIKCIYEASDLAYRQASRHVHKHNIAAFPELPELLCCLGTGDTKVSLQIF